MSFREERLKERVEEVRPGLQKAREIAELAESENRDMTDAEQKIYDEGVSKARDVADAMKQYRHDQSVFAFARELSDNVIGALSDGDLSGSSTESKSRRLCFKGMGAHVATQMLPDGMKALHLWCCRGGPRPVPRGRSRDTSLLPRPAARRGPQLRWVEIRTVAGPSRALQ